MRNGPARANVVSNDIIFKYRCNENDDFIDAKVLNLGPGGLSVQLPQAADKDSTIRFELTLGGAKTIRGESRVVWSNATENKAGVCFINLDEHAMQILNLWLSRKR